MKPETKERIMPPLILTIIAIVVSGLVVLAYNATYVDNTGVLTEKLKTACVDIFGDANYEIITKTDNEGTVSPLVYGDVVNVIVDKASGNCLFEIIADGYTKDGIDTVIGIDKDGKVAGISIVTLKETPGLGTKINNNTFLDKFKTADANTDVQSIDGITGATYSSKGMKNAVKTAIDTYTQNKEEIFGE